MFLLFIGVSRNVPLYSKLKMFMTDQFSAVVARDQRRCSGWVFHPCGNVGGPFLQRVAGGSRHLSVRGGCCPSFHMRFHSTHPVPPPWTRRFHLCGLVLSASVRACESVYTGVLYLVTRSGAL